MSGIYEMKEKEKIKGQFIKEVIEMCRKIVDFEAIEIKHKRIKEAIKCRLKFEKTVSTVLSRFVGVYDIDYAINASLADVGKLCNANRAYLFLFNDNKTTMSNTHEWCAKVINPQIENLKDISSDMFHWWMKKLLNKVFIHNAPRKVKEEFEAYSDPLKELVKACILEPIKIKKYFL